MERDNDQATVMNLLVAHEKMDDKTAYAIVKTIFDKRDELIRVHKEAENIKLENQKKEASPIPWHPGAMKYFAEKGLKLQ
jgi:TRAP transporter TAXI family solute receptor